jgi:uncharacterized protein (DUF362 family)
MMKKASVTIHRLVSPHQQESFTKFLPLNEKLRQEVFNAVKEIFDAAGGKSMLKSSGDVYVKPNAIDSKAYTYTRSELVEAVIQYWKDAGARNIYLFENSTQSNFTRMVFALTGYSRICKRLGAKEIYLDEEKNVSLEFKGKKPETDDGDGYYGTTFNVPEFITERLIKHKDENLYINLPKLKTHSMAGVTLGVKNQWAFPQPGDRRADHNYNLPYKLVDVLGYIQPDFTLIEGIEATIYGHYPVTAWADECVLPFKVLIGGKNVVAVDIVGAKLFGLGVDEVPHLKIAIDRGYSGGVASMEDIEVTGDISDFVKKQPSDLRPLLPEDVNLICGKIRHCREGCKNNPFTLLQVLYYDYGGKGDWTMVMGKGLDIDEINSVRGKVLIVGRCAIKEVGDLLVQKLGKKNVYFSGHCNDLCATTSAMCHLMKVSPLKFAPMPPLSAARLLLLARLHKSQARVPHLLANIIKTV